MKVVFHADDFGLTPAINAGIVEAHHSGLLRSTSLIVTAQAADEAAALARSLPDLDVGLHATLVEERPVLPPERIPTLVAGGRFWPTRTAVFARYASGRWSVLEGAAELAAQWERLGALGVRASHCDGHQHLHLLPRLFPRLIELARSHGVRFVRTGLAGGPWGVASPVRRALRIAVNGIAASARRRVSNVDRQATVPFETVGFLEAGGSLTREGLLAVLDRLSARGTKIVEVMVHPGRRDAETERRYGHWNYRWENDLGLLVDPALGKALARRGIEVTSFRELARDVGAS